VSVLRRLLAVVFAGDRRVWLAAALVTVPVAALLAYYSLRPRDYFTGTNSVENYGFVAAVPAGVPLCAPGLEIPAETSRVRMQLIPATGLRPALALTVTYEGARPTVARSELPPTAAAAGRPIAAVFTIPTLADRPAERAASICVTADGPVTWGGTPFPAPPRLFAATVAGRPVPALVSISYLPRAGARRSYLSRAGTILRRASLFRPAAVGRWLYVLVLLVVLPALAVASVRCLAIAAAGRRRALGAALFLIGAINFACWSFITPSFQAPDEVDHFAYTQSLVERGKAPSRDPASLLHRWSSSETLALEDVSFVSDHQVGDTRPPWGSAQQSYYRAEVRARHPVASDGGGNETAATHGPIYYAALAPAYALASSSPFSELTLMRLASALIGALTVLFTFLLARELAPGLPWLAVLAALLVAYQPMYGFISGSVNNDVGINAAAAATLLVLIRMLRRGVSVPLGLLTGTLLALLPVIKGTGYSLYPVAAVAIAAALWRHHGRRYAPGWIALLAAGVITREVFAEVRGVFRTSAGNTPGTGAASSTANAVLEHPLGYVAYVWQVFLPRLPFMASHWETTAYPGFVIFVERGWGAFGWYDVFFSHWVYVLVFVLMLAALPLGLLAARRERVALRDRLPELGVLLLAPVAVVGGFEAAFYTPGTRAVVPEFGRYVFPAIAPLAVLVAGCLLALGRRRASVAAGALLAAMLGLSYAGQLTTLTGFYA
jgi:hypothetical protein